MLSSDLPSSDSMEWKTGGIALCVPPIHQSETCASVFERFTQDPGQVATAIVDDDNRVVGIVNRLRFLARYAQRYYPELYGKKPIGRLANPKPLIVDEEVSVYELGATLALEWSDALRECFVVTRAGRYFGIGTSEALIRCKVEMLMQREGQLRQALNSATDASRTKSNFLALMSHELRTPLNAIIGFSEVLSNEMFGPLGTPRYREYSTDINGAGRHLLTLINDILDLSKTEAGKLELYLEDIHVPALFDDCIRLVAERAREQGVKITVRATDGLPTFPGDITRLKQILLNLLSNAVKFTPSGGRIELSADLDAAGNFVIAVSDNGIGMSPDMIPLALEPFRQIASPFARNIEGTGLGLSLVKSLTERHGGTLDIESALNIGTHVRLTFLRSAHPVRLAS